MSSITPATSEKALPECQCGCGATTRGGRFLPGHDAKLKKALIEAALGGSKRAINKLETLGWTKFLEAKREKMVAVEVKEKHGQSEQPPESLPRRRGRPRKNAESVTATQSGEAGGQGSDGTEAN